MSRRADNNLPCKTIKEQSFSFLCISLSIICFLHTVASCYFISWMALKKPLILHALGLKLTPISDYFWITSLCKQQAHQSHASSFCSPWRNDTGLLIFLAIFIYFSVFHFHLGSISKVRNRMTSDLRINNLIAILTITTKDLSAGVTGLVLTGNKS